jgi:hypothetical protein
MLPDFQLDNVLVNSYLKLELKTTEAKRNQNIQIVY